MTVSESLNEESSLVFAREKKGGSGGQERETEVQEDCLFWS